MIASLRGRILLIEDDTLIVEVAGVGYAVAVPAQLSAQSTVGDELLLHTAMIVREDAISLVGFTERSELAVFVALLGVSGVGPKSALGVLSHLTIEQIAAAVSAEDDAPFRRVSGIGPKTAKLIVLQLQGRLATPTPSSAPTSSTTSALMAQLVEALHGLGWSEKIADEVAARVIAEAEPSQQSVPALLRTALEQLGPARGDRVHG